LLLGLVESLHFAAGLGMVGPGVVEGDPEPAQPELEGDLAGAAVLAGEGGAAVAEPPGGYSPAGEGLVEGSDDVGTNGGAPHRGGDGEPRVGVEDVKNFPRAPGRPV